MPRKPRDRYHHGDLANALLDAAVAVIREHGVAKLSLRECARRLGVSHAAPYRHFASRDTLLSALAGRGFRQLHDRGQAAIARFDDPLERIDAYGVAYVQFAVEQPELHRVMVMGEIQDPRPEDQAAGDDAFALLLTCARAVVGDAGESETTALTIAHAFWAQVLGISMLIQGGRVPPELLAQPAEIERLTRSMFAAWRNAGRVS